MIKGIESKIVNISIVIGLSLITLILAIYIWLIYLSPLNMTEMDLNKNGWVSFSEAEYTASYKVRNVIIIGKACVEYFAIKDGLTLKVLCNDKSKSSNKSFQSDP